MADAGHNGLTVNRASILIASHSPLLTTGYGRVVREIAGALMGAGQRVVVLGMGYTGEAHGLSYRVLPWSPQAQENLPGAESPPQVPGGLTLAQALDREKLELLITIGDPWMFDGLERLPQRRGVTWLAYFPVDGRPLPRRWVEWVRAADAPVVFCRFTQEVVRTATGLTPRIIPHGVDTGAFRPMDKAAAKARVGVAGSFTVGCVAANQPRKNLPALMQAFAAFARDKPDAMLYLHTRIDGYWDIEDLAHRFGIEPRTRATLDLDPLRGVGDEILATIYNSFDVFVLPSLAEGFGLPILESQACGVPALVTDYSASPELVPDPLQRIPAKHTLILARNFEQALIDEDELARRLNVLYADRTRLDQLAQASLAFARSFDWSIARSQFVKLVGSL